MLAAGAAADEHNLPKGARMARWRRDALMVNLCPRGRLRLRLGEKAGEREPDAIQRIPLISLSGSDEIN